MNFTVFSQPKSTFSVAAGPQEGDRTSGKRCKTSEWKMAEEGGEATFPLENFPQAPKKLSDEIFYLKQVGSGKQVYD